MAIDGVSGGRAASVAYAAELEVGGTTPVAGAAELQTPGADAVSSFARAVASADLKLDVGSDGQVSVELAGRAVIYSAGDLLTTAIQPSGDGLTTPRVRLETDLNWVDHFGPTGGLSWGVERALVFHGDVMRDGARIGTLTSSGDLTLDGKPTVNLRDLNGVVFDGAGVGLDISTSAETRGFAPFGSSGAIIEIGGERLSVYDGQVSRNGEIIGTLTQGGEYDVMWDGANRSGRVVLEELPPERFMTPRYRIVG